MDNVCIPRIIMQTYKDDNIPKDWKPSPISIKKYLPNWEYRFLTDEDIRNFCKEHFPWFLQHFDAFPYNIQRVDAIRPMWLYVNGGVYMDMDYEIIDERFETLFTEDVNLFFAPSANVENYYTNSFMASKAGNPFWIYYLQSMVKPISWYKSIGKHFTVMNTTGPMMLTNLINELDEPYSIIPSNKVTPCSVCNLECDVSNSYIRPLKGSSWVATDTKVYQFCMCNTNKQNITFILLLVFLVLFVIWWMWS